MKQQHQGCILPTGQQGWLLLCHDERAEETLHASWVLDATHRSVFAIPFYCGVMYSSTWYRSSIKSLCGWYLPCPQPCAGIPFRKLSCLQLWQLLHGRCIAETKTSCPLPIWLSRRLTATVNHTAVTTSSFYRPYVGEKRKHLKQLPHPRASCPSPPGRART